MQGSIPVYISTHNEGLTKRPGYGAFVDWQIGQHVITGKEEPIGAVIKSETRWHDDAPEIEGARGRGRWIREVLMDDDHEMAAVSEAMILADESDPHWRPS